MDHHCQGETTMIRTFFAIVRFWLYLIRYIPKHFEVLRLEKEGRIAERDELVNQGVRTWARYCVALAGATVEVHGEELIPPDTAVVFIGNHQGYFDIPLMLGFINKPKAFISKIEILKVPLLNDWMKHMQCTFLDRKDMRQSIRAMAEAVETVKKGYSLVIFPEGTRSKGKPVSEFKAGSFKLPFKAGVPIVPVTIDGSWRILEEKGHFQKAHVRITVHPPIETANLDREQQAAIPARVQEIVQKGLSNIS